MISKYVLREPYKILTDSNKPKSDTYNLIRQLTNNRTTASISVALFSTKEGIEAIIHDNRENSIPKHHVFIPSKESTCPGTLLIRMGIHTLSEIRDMYYETWAAEIESQIQNIQKGDDQ